eukprot:1704677-Amphidinium_carterae.1
MQRQVTAAKRTSGEEKKEEVFSVARQTVQSCTPTIGTFATLALTCIPVSPAAPQAQPSTEVSGTPTCVTPVCFRKCKALH